MLMFERFFSFFWKNYATEKDPHIRGSTEIFLKTIALVFLLRLIIISYQMFQGWGPLAWSTLAQLSALFFSLLLFRRLQNTYWPSVMASASFFILILFSMRFTDGIHSAITTNVPIVIFFSIVLTGFRWALAWTLLFMAVMVGYYWMGQHNFLPPNILTVQEQEQFRLVTYLTSSIFFLLQYAIYRSAFLDYRTLLQNQRKESSHVLQVISHDLRSPLQIIHSYSQLLEDEQDPHRRRDFLAQIDKSIKRTSLLLNQIRHYEATLGGKKPAQLVPVNLLRTLEDLWVTLEPHHHVKDLSVEILVNNRIPQETDDFWVWGEPLLWLSRFWRTS